MDPPRASQEQLFEHYESMLAFAIRYARVELGLREDQAKDEVQTVFAEICANESPASRPRIHPEKGPRAWLVTVIMNRLRRRARRNGKEKPLADEAADELTAPTLSPLDQAIMNEEERRRRRAVRDTMAALMLLEQHYREVLWLKFAEGLTPMAIAERLHRPYQTVRTQLSRGKELLRERLLADHDDDGDKYRDTLLLLARTRIPGPVAVSSQTSTPQQVAKQPDPAVPDDKTLLSKRFRVRTLATASVALVLVVLAFVALRGQPSSLDPQADAPHATLEAPQQGQFAGLDAAQEVATPLHPTGDLGHSVAAVLGGRVVDTDGKPVAGASVSYVYRRSADSVLFLDEVTKSDGTFSAVPRERALDDADRALLMDGLAEDMLADCLSIRDATHAPLLARPWDSYRSQQVSAEFTPGTPCDWGDLVLTDGARVQGRIIDEAGRGIADARILLADECPDVAAGTPLQRSRAMTQANQDGWFTLPDRVGSTTTWPARFWLVAVSSDGIGATQLPAVGESSTSDVEVTITQGEHAQLTLRTTDGAPVSGASVRVMPLREPFTQSPQLHADELASEDLHDSYACGLSSDPETASLVDYRSDANGEVTVRAEPAAGAVVWVQADHCMATDVVLPTLAVGSDIVITLLPPATLTLRGVVTDDESHGPIKEARVTVNYLGDSAKWEATSLPDGSFSLEVDRRNGRYLSLSCDAPGYEWLKQDRKLVTADMAGDCDWPVEVNSDSAMSDGRSVRGVVRTASGEPVGGMNLAAVADGDAPLACEHDAQSASDGSFTFENVEDRPHRIVGHLNRTDSQWSLLSTPIISGSDTDVALVAVPTEASGHLRLELVDQAGSRVLPLLVDAGQANPCADPQGTAPASVDVFLAGGDAVVTAGEGSDGARVWLVDAAGRVAYCDLDAARTTPADKLPVQLLVGAAGGLSGRISGVMQGSHPASGSTVSYLLQGRLPGARTASLMKSWDAIASQRIVGEDGSFELSGLLPGAYDVVATSDSGVFVGTASVLAGQTLPVDLRPIPTGSVRIVGGDELKGATIRLETVRPLWTRQCTEVAVNAGSEFSVTAVPVGKVAWQVVDRTPSSGMDWSGDCEVLPGATTTLTVK